MGRYRCRANATRFPFSHMRIALHRHVLCRTHLQDHEDSEARCHQSFQVKSLPLIWLRFRLRRAYLETYRHHLKGHIKGDSSASKEQCSSLSKSLASDKVRRTLCLQPTAISLRVLLSLLNLLGNMPFGCRREDSGRQTAIVTCPVGRKTLPEHPGGS
jgi:hypothetical protein